MPSFEIEINFNVNTDALTDAETELQNISSSADEAGSSADSLDDSISNVDGSALSETSNEADSLAGSLDDAAQSSDELGNSLNIIEGGMLLGISDQISSMSSGFEGMAQQMNSASISVGQLSTNVGMAEPQMVSLINNISNATFPQSEAMAYVKSLNQMGVEADKLSDAATNMDRINDATGSLNAQGVMQLTQGLRSVGIEADNLPSAFNAIAYAEANVNGGAATMSQVFKRQAATINEYGLTADQTVLIMQKLSEQGVQGMKMGSELSNVLKENNGDISAIEQSLGMQSGALANATAETGKYEGKLMDLADEEKQHKTALDQIGAAWEDVSLSLSPVLSPLGSAVGLLGQIGSVGMSVMGLRSLAQGMREVTTAINIMRNAESLSAGVKAVLATVLGVETAAEEADTVAKSAAIGPTAGLAIAENSLLLPILLVTAAIVALIAILWYLYNNNETVRIGINQLIAKFQQFLMKLEIVKNIIIMFVQVAIQRFMQWVNNGKQSATNLVDGIYNTLTSLPNKVSSAVSGITNILTKPFTDAWNNISPLINKIGDGLNKLNPTSWFGAEYEGFDIAYEGFESLNGTISNAASNSSTINNNFNINGIIEEEASQFIVGSVNDYMKKQNLIRGVGQWQGI